MNRQSGEKPEPKELVYFENEGFVCKNIERLTGHKCIGSYKPRAKKKPHHIISGEEGGR